MNAQSNEERLARLETTIEHLATKEDLLEVRRDMAELKSSLIQWMVGLQIASAALLITLTRAWPLK
jgi:hypothetical protein